MTATPQKTKGPAATGIAPDHGSTNTPPNEMIMNRMEDSTAAAGAASASRIGAGMGPSYGVSNLASLFTVCAIALDGTDEWSKGIADRARQDIKHVLEWGALLAVGICVEVEHLEAEAGRAQA